MNRKDIIRMANKAYGIDEEGKPFHPSALLHLEIFANLVASAEREACAYRAGIALLGADRGLANRVDQAIRERGQA
jgi:hypothetical protein